MKISIARGALLGATALASLSYGGGSDDAQEHRSGRTRYRIVSLSSLGGTNSRANSINNAGLVTGYSNLPDGTRHATAWFFGALADLGTLGGPSSGVFWPVKNNNGIVAGISYTDKPDPNNEDWSCGFFLTGEPEGQHLQCLAFVWEWGVMRPLATLGGTHGFATGVSNRREVVGWAENDFVDPDCDPNSAQKLQFRPVVWGPGTDDIRELPLYSDDTSGAATAINNRGQIVGISGTCDQAVGRRTAEHAVLWERDGGVISIGNLGRETWNTPMAINEHGVVVGFAPINDDDPDDPVTHAFLWRRGRGMEDLGVLKDDLTSQANGINRHGQVVGTSTGALGSRAFLWEHGVMKDLKELLDAPFPYDLENAQDINDQGVIVGRAIDRTTTPTQRWAFVAVPVPDND